MSAARNRTELTRWLDAMLGIGFDIDIGGGRHRGRDQDLSNELESTDAQDTP